MIENVPYLRSVKSPLETEHSSFFSCTLYNRSVFLLNVFKNAALNHPHNGIKTPVLNDTFLLKE